MAKRPEPIDELSVGATVALLPDAQVRWKDAIVKMAPNSSFGIEIGAPLIVAEIAIRGKRGYIRVEGHPHLMLGIKRFRRVSQWRSIDEEEEARLDALAAARVRIALQAYADRLLATSDTNVADMINYLLAEDAPDDDAGNEALLDIARTMRDALDEKGK